MFMVMVGIIVGLVNCEDEVKEIVDEEVVKFRFIMRERRVGRRSLVLNLRLRGE